MKSAKLAFELLAVLALLVACALGQAQTPDEALKPTGPPIDVSNASSLISMPAGQPVVRQLVVPRRDALTNWTVVSGKLPLGLDLTSAGVLHGKPKQAGRFTFDLSATDAAGTLNLPQMVINVTENIVIAWKQPPHIENDSVVGSVEIENYLSRPADVTFIVVAVNEVNKAFALGYQRYTMGPNSSPQAVPFGAALPFGSYIVHADTIAEIPESNSIYRSRLQTATRLVVAQH